MSEWDFLWGLEGDELMDAMASGATASDWDYIEQQEMRKRKTANSSNTKQIKKKKLVLFIDAENVSYNYATKIMENISKCGQLAEARYYALQKDDSTRFWREQAKHHDIKPILVYGEASKNKIDNKIIKDAKYLLRQNKNIDIFCIATKDGDYTSLVSFLREHRKRVIILGPKGTSQKLITASSKFILL